MSELTATKTIPRSFMIIGIVAIVWNLLGVMSYLMSVMMSPEALAAMPEEQRALYNDIPALVTSAYAIAVFGGLLGSVLLVLKKALAVPVLAVSLIGILVQMLYTLVLSDVIAVQGPASMIFPIIVIIIGALLVWYANSAKAKGWIK